MQSDEYRKLEGISQSAIKDFRFKAPQTWKEIWIDGKKDDEKDDEDYIFGSLVDTLRFSPHKLDERFFITSSNAIPKGAIKSIVKSVHGRISEFKVQRTRVEQEELPEPIEKVDYNFRSYEDLILACCDEHINDEGKKGWNSSWKRETRIKKVIEEGTDYFNFLVESGGREVISSEMNLEAIEAVKALEMSEITKKYFSRSDTRYTNIFQLEISSPVEVSPGQNVMLKGALDDFHIDHEFKRLQVVDLKTTFSAFNFLQSIKQFSYVDQVSVYQTLAEKVIKQDWFIEKYGDLSEYRFKEPINIAIDRKFKKPYIYEYDWKDLAISKDGNANFLREFYDTTEHYSRVKKGWLEILREIAWHLENKKWDYPVEHYASGKIKVNLINS